MCTQCGTYTIATYHLNFIHLAISDHLLPQSKLQFYFNLDAFWSTYRKTSKNQYLVPRIYVSRLMQNAGQDFQAVYSISGSFRRVLWWWQLCSIHQDLETKNTCIIIQRNHGAEYHTEPRNLGYLQSVQIVSINGRKRQSSPPYGTGVRTRDHQG